MPPIEYRPLQNTSDFNALWTRSSVWQRIIICHSVPRHDSHCFVSWLSTARLSQNQGENYPGGIIAVDVYRIRQSYVSFGLSMCWTGPDFCFMFHRYRLVKAMIFFHSGSSKKIILTIYWTYFHYEEIVECHHGLMPAECNRRGNENITKLKDWQRTGKHGERRKETPNILNRRYHYKRRRLASCCFLFVIMVHQHRPNIKSEKIIGPTVNSAYDQLREFYSAMLAYLFGCSLFLYSPPPPSITSSRFLIPMV